MAKLMVPMRLQRDNPLLYELACDADNQVQADALISIEYPEWSWSEAVTRVKGVKGDQQAAGSYSLNLTSGGARYHEVSPGERETVVGQGPTLLAMFTVDHVQSPPSDYDNHKTYPKGTRRLSGRRGGMLLP